MAVTTTQTNKPINPRGNDQSPKGYNRAELYTGKALDFDGVNDYLASDSFSLDTSEWSASMILKNDTAGSDQVFLAFAATGSNDESFIFYNNFSSSNKISFYGAAFTGSPVVFDYVIPTDYEHLTFTFASNTLSLYVNGVFVDSGSVTANDGTQTASAIVGARKQAAYGQYFNGQVSGLKVYSTALTAAQVADLYNNPEKIVPTGVADSALKLWLPMQEGAGTTAFNGAPDALGSEQITGFTNGSTYAFDTFTTSGNDISSAIKTSGFAGAASNAISLTNGDKVFVSFDYTHTSGDPLRVLISQNASGAGATMSDVAYISTTGKFTHIFTVTSTQDGYLQLGTGGSTQSINASMENISFKIVSGIGTISGATWTHGIGAPVSQTSVIDWNKWTLDGTNEVLVPEGLTAGRDLLGNLFENVRKQGALNLDGNSWAEVHDNASLDFGTGSFSIEAWAKVKYVNDGSSYNAILTLGGNAADNTSLSITSSLEPRFEYAGDSSSVSSSNEGDWVHLVGTYDETNATFYINGSQEDQDARTATDITNALAKRIGRDSTSTRFYNDQIAQPRIYNRALTAEEVERNYNAGKNIYK